MNRAQRIAIVVVLAVAGAFIAGPRVRGRDAEDKTGSTAPVKATATPPAPASSAAPAAAAADLDEFVKAAPAVIDLGGTPSKGAADAPIKIVDYSDYLCPHCRNVAHALGQWLPSTKGRATVYYKNYPLDPACNPRARAHPGACWLAYGGVCAQEQGKFWAYHDRVFALPPSKTAPDRVFVAKLGAELGMNATTFDTCLGSSATHARVAAEIEEGTKAGVGATPTLFINNKRLPKLHLFFPAVEDEARRLGAGTLPAP